MNSLRGFDLNLLVTLDALLTEHNVTRAAERLHLSQPTVSVQLARLRKIFDDPLLLPGPRGMRPTARADELREPLRQALAVLGQVVAPSDTFSPALANQNWHVAAFDYGALTILVPALATLRAAAPATRLAVVQSMPSLVARQAEQGDIDLAFMTDAEAPLDLHRLSLFTDRYVLTGRADHPGLKSPLSLDEFCQLEHVIVSPDGGGFYGATDTELAKRGMARRVSLSVSNFLLLGAILTSTDLVTMMPWRLVRGNDALQVVEPPLDVPEFEMLMLWPERVHRDHAHQWLRKHIACSVRA
ncbi:LysR family transcriptional regulator [Citrobacter portucalensis]|uniref:LysR family transcriptional regulator n=1 Tax=Citrobacter portucalensis TaxID=1639133 RepID=UPI00226B4AAF|nr:LysR family transcriptional regulator [Citrobacter portucalensis]MCX8984225.1 LysR family transcriptional regulator [Citrobacter portucalensis]